MARSTWLSTVPELPRAPRTAPAAIAVATSATDGTRPSAMAGAAASSAAASAAFIVAAMFDPVSASGTGNTLSWLISSRRRSSTPTHLRTQLSRADPSMSA